MGDELDNQWWSSHGSCLLKESCVNLRSLRMQLHWELGLLSNMFLHREEANCSMWKPNTSGPFSVKYFYIFLETPMTDRPPCSWIWPGLSPARVEAFCWLVMIGKVSNSTVDHLRRWGASSGAISDVCIMCKEESRLVIFFFSVISLSLWSHCLHSSGGAWCFLASLCDMVLSRRTGPFLGSGLMLRRINHCVILWKERNDRIFRGAELSISDLLHLISVKMYKWSLVRKECQNLSLDYIFLVGLLVWVVDPWRKKNGRDGLPLL